MKRIPQPPVNPALRALERHAFWPSLAAAIASMALFTFGARHHTGVDTVDGGSASEIQLMKAFASSGLQFASEQAPPPPPQLSDPAAQAEALDRWAKQQAIAARQTWKIRVDTAAKTPCPT